MKSVAIIGAGISGLYLANLFKNNKDYKVTIYEKKDFVLNKINKKNKDKYYLLKVFKKNQKYLLIKNTEFNFLKNFDIFPMQEIIKPKNFNKDLNIKLSNMNMNIKIEYNNKAKSVTTPNWIDPKNLHNYTLPTFTKKIVNYLENHK